MRIAGRLVWAGIGLLGGCATAAPPSVTGGSPARSASPATVASTPQPPTQRGSAPQGGSGSGSVPRSESSAHQPAPVPQPVPQSGPDSAGTSGAEAPQAKSVFAGRAEVTYGEFIGEMRAVADRLAAHAAVQDAHQQLLHRTGLTPDELTLASFSRVRLAFEATRDGGLWGLRWAITDKMPWSDEIWRQWRSAPSLENDADAVLFGTEAPTATAECDELSALFALIARDLGVDGFVGLHWPYWNHTVAVWQLSHGRAASVRILVPTSQVFLSREATLGTRELPTQRVVFPYVRVDLRPESLLPGALARFLLHRLELFGAEPDAALQARRNRLGGS